METATAGRTGPASDSSFLGRHEFLIRRLHSLSGLVPIGAFMTVHLLTNASVLGGAQSFQANVDRIHSLGPILPLVEWAFIFLPLLFHAIIGVVIVRGGLPNTGRYPLVNNVRYTLQRVTGMIAFAYIVWHVLHMHALGKPLSGFGGGQFDPHHATSTAAVALQSVWWVQLLYAIGILSCVYHLANGLWTMGITWGIWISPAAQRRADYVCGALGVGLALVGLSALFGFGQVDPEQARAVEQVLKTEEEHLQQQIEKLQSGGESGAKTSGTQPTGGTGHSSE